MLCDVSLAPASELSYLLFDANLYFRLWSAKWLCFNFNLFIRKLAWLPIEMADGAYPNPGAVDSIRRVAFPIIRIIMKTMVFIHQAPLTQFAFSYTMSIPQMHRWTNAERCWHFAVYGELILEIWGVHADSPTECREEPIGSSTLGNISVYQIIRGYCQPLPIWLYGCSAVESWQSTGNPSSELHKWSHSQCRLRKHMVPLWGLKDI